MALFLILPTRGEGANRYRGKRPTFPRSISAGATGLHVELYNGLRLWAAPGFGPAELPKLDSDFAEIAAAAPAMTAEQYAALLEAAELLRERPTKRDLATSMARRIPGMVESEGPYIVTGRSVDGVEYLTGMGWSGDYQTALIMTAADAKEIAAREEKKAAATRGPDSGVYQIAARPWNGPRLYRLADYEADESEAARMAEYFRANP